MIPKALYELLPTVYMVGGTASATSVDATYGALSGALLVVCGYAIGVMRERYRVRHAAIKHDGWSRSI